MRLLMLVSRARAAWGFAVRVAGASAVQPALPLPPPSSVAGFYAETLARVLGLGEALRNGWLEGLASSVLAAGAGLEPGSRVGSAVYSDTGRLLSLIYQRPRGNWMDYAWAAQSLGAAYAPGAVVTLAIVVDVEGLARSLKAPVDRVEEALMAGGVRLGSKEGLVAVLETRAGEPEVLGEGAEYGSLLYQDSLLADHVEGGVAEVEMWGLEALRERSITPRYRVFYVPASPASTPSIIIPPGEPAVFRARRGARVYCLGGDMCIAGGGG